MAGLVDVARQYKEAAVIGALGLVFVGTTGVIETRDVHPPETRIRSVAGPTTFVTLPPVTTTVTATVTATSSPSSSPTGTAGPSMLPSQLPSSVPPSNSATPTPSATPTFTPSPTLTPRNHANGLARWCVIAIDHHGEVIKRPCKETP